MLERAPFLAALVGPQAYHRLPELLARRARDRGAQIDTEFPVESKFDRLPREVGDTPVSAFLTVQEGCDKFCTFCVVPYTRGAEAEPAGFRHLGRSACSPCWWGARDHAFGSERQRVPWGRPEWPSVAFGALIAALAELDGLLRIRYTTSHPRDMDPS